MDQINHDLTDNLLINDKSFFTFNFLQKVDQLFESAIILSLILLSGFFSFTFTPLLSHSIDASVSCQMSWLGEHYFSNDLGRNYSF